MDWPECVYTKQNVKCEDYFGSNSGDLSAQKNYPLSFSASQSPTNSLIVCSSGEFLSLKVENSSSICQSVLDE